MFKDREKRQLTDSLELPFIGLQFRHSFISQSYVSPITGFVGFLRLALVILWFCGTVTCHQPKRGPSLAVFGKYAGTVQKEGFHF